MKSKSVILSLLVMSLLVMAQIQVEANICCRTQSGRNGYILCTRFAMARTQNVCLSINDCVITGWNGCPGSYPNDNLNKSGDLVNEYCKLGCASFVCSALTTLQNSDATEVVNGAVEKCTKTCSTLCTKGSITAVESA